MTVQQAPSPDAINDAVRDVLASPDFQYAPRSRGFFDRIVEWLRDGLDALSGLRTSMPVLAWLIVGLAAALIAFVLARIIVAWIRTSRDDREDKSRSAAEAVRRARELMEAARSAAAAGNAPRALTLYVRAVIVGLDERGLQRQRETATLREYLVLLTPHAADRALLERLLRSYEPAVFGRRPVLPDDLKACDDIAGRLSGAAP